jgi:demethylmenaquinone methyltransferase/2-methoxy-6-polyprenyl-1,4-benzoquinol methylase
MEWFRTNGETGVGKERFRLVMVDTNQKRTAEPEAALTGGPSRNQVWKMFDRIAGRYDLLNHLLSANFDRKWRRRVAAQLPGHNSLRVLDLASGTGDQLITLAKNERVKEGIGIDLSERMLRQGRDKIARLNLNAELQSGDAQNIPFNTGQFDAVTISFGIRNMTDVRRTLNEMYRVLKPGGRALVLEFSLPSNRPVRALYLFYLRHILPFLGKLISGDNAAYRYLNETIETFPHGQAFCDLMSECCFANIKMLPLTLGIVAIYRGDKP